jgi:hypothetical protein
LFVDMTAIGRLNVTMKSSSDEATSSINEIANRFWLATHVLRHWETTGLLTPARALAAPTLRPPRTSTEWR